MVPDPARRSRGGPRSKTWLWVVSLGVVSTSWFAFDLPGEPRFIDESAYLSQTYYADLFLAGDWHSPLWLDYGAIDLPPLPKYCFGVALRLAGRDRFGPAMARRWYANPGRFVVGSSDDLTLARYSVIPFGTLGCLSTFAIGTMAIDRRVGLVAGLILMVDPLYCVHARRAMSDVPCESLVLATIALGLWAWRACLSGRMGWLRGFASGVGTGVLAGLAILAKLSGGLGLMVVAAQLVLGLVLPGFPIRGKLLLTMASAIAAAVAFFTFVAFNPVVWAHPRAGLPSGATELARLGIVSRTRLVVKFRADVSEMAMRNPNFKKDVLRRPIEKTLAVLVQGFGRFGPLGPRTLDSTLRYDPERDRGVLIWAPLVLLGAILAMIRGSRQRNQGQPPTAWALMAQFVVVMVTVIAFIPLAWDRYMLPVQSVAALLGSAAIVGIGDRVFGARATGPVS